MAKDMVKKDTRFVKGRSGNPRGRPKGSKNKATLLKEAMQKKADIMLSKELPAVLKTVVAAAKGGDMQAAKMILDRTIPTKRADDGNDDTGNKLVQITIQNLTSPHDEKEPGVTINGETV